LPSIISLNEELFFVIRMILLSTIEIGFPCKDLIQVFPSLKSSLSSSLLNFNLTHDNSTSTALMFKVGFEKKMFSYPDAFFC